MSRNVARTGVDGEASAMETIEAEADPELVLVELAEYSVAVVESLSAVLRDVVAMPTLGTQPPLDVEFTHHFLQTEPIPPSPPGSSLGPSSFLLVTSPSSISMI